MNKLKLIKLISILVTVTLMTGCASQSQDSFVTQHNSYKLSHEVELDQRQRADLFEAIIAADLADHNKDYLTAMSYYLFAAELSQNQQLIQKSINAAQNAKDELGMQQASKIWLSISPDNVQAMTLLLEAQLALQNLPDALETATTLIEKYKDDKQKFDLLNTSVINKEPRIAFNLLRELNDKLPDEVAIVTAQAKFVFYMSNKSKNSDKLLIQALQKTEDALALDPLFYPAISLKAHILFQSRREIQALNYLRTLYYNNQNSAEISQMLGQLLYDMRDYDASIEHYTKWLGKHPRDLEAKNYLAASYYALKQYDQSAKHFHHLVTKGFKIPSSAFYCGDSAMKSANIEQAIDCFQQVNQGRFLALSKILLASMLSKQKQITQALEVLQTKYAVSDEDKIKLEIAEIDLLKMHFSYESAKQRLAKSLEKNPASLVLILKQVELYQLLDKPAELESILSSARALLESGNKLDRFNLAAAALFRNNQHYQLAIKWLNEALLIKPDDKNLLYTRALYKEPLGLYSEMIEEFKYLLTIYPDDLNIKNALGYTLVDLKQDLDYAQALIDSAYQGLPNSPAVIDSKGWLAYRRGNLNAAEEYLKRAFQLSPSAEGAAHLGEVLWRKSQYESAKIILKKGLDFDENNKILKETLERLNIEI